MAASSSLRFGLKIASSSLYHSILKPHPHEKQGFGNSDPDINILQIFEIYRSDEMRNTDHYPRVFMDRGLVCVRFQVY